VCHLSVLPNVSMCVTCLSFLMCSVFSYIFHLFSLQGLLYEANLSDHSQGNRSVGSSNTSITDRSNRRNKRNRSRKEKDLKKGTKCLGKEALIQTVSLPSPDRQVPCVKSYSRLIGGSKHIASHELPDNLMENVEEGLIKNPIIGQGEEEEDGEGPGNVISYSGDRKNENMNEGADGDGDIEGNIQNDMDEEDDADIPGMQGIQGLPCQPPLSDEFDINYLSFSSSSSALHSGSSSYEHRGLRTNSRDDGSDDVLNSAEEDTDTDMYTETSSSKSGAVILHMQRDLSAIIVYQHLSEKQHDSKPTTLYMTLHTPHPYLTPHTHT
jgi:hypothetical protein